tara:strand:- start:330 stop:770 length:441 start_codon:yes stop_codon:yes gene_type:complete
MTKFYKIEPKNKKSVYEYSTYSNDDKTISFTFEEMYRWGWCVISIDDEEDINDYVTADSEDEFFETDTLSKQYIDGEMDDTSSTYFLDCKGITEEQLENEMQEDGYDMFQKYGGDPEDFWKEFKGELTVTDVTDKYANYKGDGFKE